MKCLIADTMHESLFPMLAEIGVACDYLPKITREELIAKLPSYQGLIIRSKTRVDAALLGESPSLVFVGRAGAGIDNLDEEVLKAHNIAILNAPEGNRNAVAEHTLGLLLALLHRIVKGDREVRGGTWDREGNRGYELQGQTIGIIGYGYMGMAFARKLSSMGCRVLAYDKYKSDFSDDYCREATMEELHEEADCLSLHVPLTQETRALVDKSYLSRFRKPVMLINTARGGIVVQEDLLNALETGKVAGAALDVLENEKIDRLTEAQKKIFEKLCASDRVILTPHVAGWTFESYVRINEVLCQKIAEATAHLR